MKTNEHGTLNALLDAIPPEKIESPNIPIAVALQEARDLERTARDSWTTLDGVGAKLEWLTAMPLLISHLGEKEAAWGKVRYSGHTQAEKSLTEKAEWVRREMNAAGEYAFCGDEAIMVRVLFTILKKTIGLRPTTEDEIMGLDLTEHGEAGYN